MASATWCRHSTGRSGSAWASASPTSVMNRALAFARDTGRSTVTIFPSARLSSGLICSTEPTLAVVGLIRPPRRSVSSERTWMSTCAR